MAKLLIAVFLLAILNHETKMAGASGDEDFFQGCKPSRCGHHGREVRYPFRLESNSESCGAPGMQLSCSGRDTILLHPILGACKVNRIDYTEGTIDIKVIGKPWCPLQDIVDTNLSTQIYQTGYTSPVSMVRCATEFTYSFHEARIAGPISCLSSASQSMYVVHGYEPMSILPLDCIVRSNGIQVPVSLENPYDFNAKVQNFLEQGEMTLSWSVPNITDVCKSCEAENQHCGFSSERRQAFCGHHGSKVTVIAATLVPIFLALSLMGIALYLSVKSKYDEEIYLKVEMFLRTYSTSQPTRYTFSQVKKITKRFTDKLGQGGFGSVYRGELPNGVPVAVKMLEKSKEEGEEFINEVATIGRIHHANVVRLLGFCSEGTRRALIYEFMPNESLEKYIFSRDSSIAQELLRPNKLLDIALGIARGIEYLHQGCNQRILHFDIKPHNILLDYSFNPKISDFGLAKLCARDQSIITLTAARGTMGYIAPELYSRNFGVISYKSDVYSFGMLVLEMVSGKRNSEPGIENEEEVYIPERIYEQFVSGQEIGLAREMTEEEKEVVRKLAVVALWCIQWNPTDRPTMTRVVQMLMGSLQSLQVPPKPFVSSLRYPM